ncbi:UDP-N-acetylglucosamine 2-epimerase [Thermoproteota archaeon]
MYIESCINLIEKQRPKAVCIVDETSLFGRCRIAAAKLKNIPVISTQHGYISNDFFDYLHIKGDISKDLDFHKPFCPTPDKTLVYGPHTKKILVQPGNYPAHSVVVTGQPRYDHIGKTSSNNLNKKKILDKYHIKKKMILWTTEEAPEQEAAVFMAAKRIKNAQLVIRIHPKELNEPSYYYKKAREYGVKIIATKTENTLELINASDAVIVKHSTTGLEAIMLGKPVVVLNLSGRPDLATYAQKGAALGVYNAEDLEKALNKALFDKKTRSGLNKAQKAYSYDHCYKMDGKATKRALKVIESLI